MSEKPTVKEIKPRVLLAIKDGRIYQTATGQLGCSDFSLAIALSSLGVKTAERLSPALSNVTALDPQTLKTAFGLSDDVKFEQRPGDLKRLI